LAFALEVAASWFATVGDGLDYVSELGDVFENVSDSERADDVDLYRQSIILRVRWLVVLTSGARSDSLGKVYNYPISINYQKLEFIWSLT
jgi:hypothetical protein